MEKAQVVVSFPSSNPREANALSGDSSNRPRSPILLLRLSASIPMTITPAGLDHAGPWRFWVWRAMVIGMNIQKSRFFFEFFFGFYRKIVDFFPNMAIYSTITVCAYIYMKKAPLASRGVYQHQATGVFAGR
jgi:hypothetical protein